MLYRKSVRNLETYRVTIYNIFMCEKDRKKIAYIIACISEFADATGLTAREAFRYLNHHGGIDFLIECYETEHTLSLRDAVDDLKLVTQKSGGLIA
jgi:hypothetical protein